MHVETTVYNKFEIFVRKIAANISENVLNAHVAQYCTSGHVKVHVTGSTFLWQLNKKCQKYQKIWKNLNFKNILSISAIKGLR
jgi:hypothetical protein